MTTTKKLGLAIEGMSCAFCVKRVEKSLTALPGVNNATVNLAKQRARVVYDAQRFQPETLIAAIEKVGYEGRPIVAQDDNAQRQAQAHDAQARQLQKAF